jgi:hypothetical protein
MFESTGLARSAFLRNADLGPKPIFWAVTFLSLSTGLLINWPAN